MLRAYFDANVYNRLEEGATPEDLVALRNAFRDGRIVAHVSPTNIAEQLVYLWPKDRAQVIRRLRRIRELVGFHQGILKEPRDVLSEAFNAYASESDPPSVLLAEDLRRQVVQTFSDIISGSSRADNTLSELASDHRAIMDRFLLNMKQNQEETLALMASRGITDRNAPSFEAFWRNANS